ncbi:MAG TPA: TIGR04255 family protein [Candidatus Binataceae bacterium]|nr:TIGR04255 family protein [Candidatus Binataceae bacterium]
MAKSFDFPHFNRPPIAEVALSVQFEALPNFHAAHIGLYWNEIRLHFPKTQEQPPLPPAQERFGVRLPAPQINVMLGTAPKVPRCWFLNEDETRLIQVQQDRFIYNWRKKPNSQVQADDYPRYKVLRESFRSELATFIRFLEASSLGEFKPIQCELVYVNQITLDINWKEHRDIANLVTFWRDPTDDLLAKPEDVNISARYIIKDSNDQPAGRLHLVLTPTFSSAGEPIYQFQTVARGFPVAPGMDGIFTFLEKGHEYAMRALLAVASPELQKLWEKRYVS